jgi:hypothetical protein
MLQSQLQRLHQQKGPVAPLAQLCQGHMAIPAAQQQRQAAGTRAFM